MSAPICRCGRDKNRHDPSPANSYRPLCRSYDAMDFEPYADQIDNCCCGLCNALAFEVSKPQGDWVPLSNALFDALAAGRHVYVGKGEWIEKLRANSPGGRGFQSSGSFMATGMGIGVTPGGVTGASRMHPVSAP